MSTLVLVVDEAGIGCSQDTVADLVRAVLDADGAQGSVTVVLVDESAIAELNGRYRGLDEPTDVLAFGYAHVGPGGPDWPFPEPPVENGPVGGETTPDLGEVIVCPAVVRRYAEEDGCEAGRQLGWTIIHGVLHLLGYDHERDEGEMRRREQALLGDLGPVASALSLSANI
jgi:probable rRNA maturation factor